MILINNRCKGVRVEGKGETEARCVYEKPIKIRRNSRKKKIFKKKSRKCLVVLKLFVILQPKKVVNVASFTLVRDLIS